MNIYIYEFLQRKLISWLSKREKLPISLPKKVLENKVWTLDWDEIDSAAINATIDNKDVVPNIEIKYNPNDSSEVYVVGRAIKAENASDLLSNEIKLIDKITSPIHGIYFLSWKTFKQKEIKEFKSLLQKAHQKKFGKQISVIEWVPVGSEEIANPEQYTRERIQNLIDRGL